MNYVKYYTNFMNDDNDWLPYIEKFLITFIWQFKNKIVFVVILELMM